jgi:hypothetical protein
MLEAFKTRMLIGPWLPHFLHNILGSWTLNLLYLLIVDEINFECMQALLDSLNNKCLIDISFNFPHKCIPS